MRSGRVRLEQSDTDSGESEEQYLAPEYRPGGQVACDGSLEKVRVQVLQVFAPTYSTQEQSARVWENFGTAFFTQEIKRL